MPNLTLHPLSVVIGLALAGLVALTTSQASPPPATLNPASIRIEYTRIDAGIMFNGASNARTCRRRVSLAAPSDRSEPAFDTPIT